MVILKDFPYPYIYNSALFGLVIEWSLIEVDSKWWFFSHVVTNLRTNEFCWCPFFVFSPCASIQSCKHMVIHPHCSRLQKSTSRGSGTTFTIAHAPRWRLTVASERGRFTRVRQEQGSAKATVYSYSFGQIQQYGWWFRNPANQLRLVVYPIIYKAFFASQVGFRRISEPSTVSLYLWKAQQESLVSRLGYSF